MDTKTCKRCHEEKPREAFPLDSKRPDGLFSYCKECHREHQKQWQLDNPERHLENLAKERDRARQWREANPEDYKIKVRRDSLRHRYGITPEQYDDILRHQGGGCAVCGDPDGDSRGYPLHVDHDHLTGEVRGLVCFVDNVVLSVLDRSGDPEGHAAAAIEYLESPPAQMVLAA